MTAVVASCDFCLCISVMYHEGLETFKNLEKTVEKTSINWRIASKS